MNTAELAFVALGSNLGDSVDILRHAMDELRSFSDKPLLKSSLWQSAPVDCPPGSPPFVNAMVAFEPQAGETAIILLPKLRNVEKKFGRQPKQILNEPRFLDLDLIAFGSQVVNTPELTVPHPRAHLRRFVLQPLSEIAPDLVLIGQTKNVRELLKLLKCPEENVRRPIDD